MKRDFYFLLYIPTKTFSIKAPITKILIIVIFILDEFHSQKKGLKLMKTTYVENE